MDARREKRVKQIAHIMQKPYYRETGPLQPDPYSYPEMSTRMWKFTVRTWIQAMKMSYSKEAAVQSRHQDGASLAVMGGS